MSPADFCSVSEFAKLVGISRNTAYRMVHRKKLPGVRRFGARVRIHKPTILAWFARSGE